MKVRDFMFLEGFINCAEIMSLVKTFIQDGRTRRKLPRRFNGNLPNVPYTLLPKQDCEYTIWIVIHYEGCNTLYLMPDDCTGVMCPVNAQRAICVKLGDGVSWDLYQTDASKIRYNDVKDGIRTFQKC